MLFRVAFAEVKSHAEAEDIMQEVFIRLIKADPDFKSEEHDFFKSKWQRSVTGLDGVAEDEKVYMRIPYLEQDDTLWLVLSLREQYRQCLYLFYYEDYGIREIAEALEIPVNTVKTNLRRGREELKKLLIRER